MKAKLIIAAMAVAALCATEKADACSRVVYTGDTASVSSPEQVLRVVGRSLDWSTPIPTNLYVYPRGMKKQSNNKGKILKWTSKYGSVYAVSYGGGITEGMNECGLAINGLFCRSTVYNVNNDDPTKPQMSLAVIVAWMLDNCATTQEVIDLVKAQDFIITGATFDGGTVSTLHWGVTDATGYTAVLEFEKGHLNIYQGYDLPVLTNDPPFPDMQAINAYWESVGGQNMLPGSPRSADRFVRGYYFNNDVEHTNDAATGLAIIRSIMADVSVPYKYTRGDKNLSQTQWRSYSNLRDRQYWFQNVTDLGLYCVDLTKCNLAVGAPVLTLDTALATQFVGDVTSLLAPTQPFTPMY